MSSQAAERCRIDRRRRRGHVNPAQRDDGQLLVGLLDGEIGHPVAEVVDPLFQDRSAAA